MNVLFATRAFQSPPTEGGYLVLKDLAVASHNDKDIQASFFSLKDAAAPNLNNIQFIPTFSRRGWGKYQATQFVYKLGVQAKNYDIVHTSHVPTKTNSLIFNRIKSKNKDTRFVQTITALPAAYSLSSKLLWGDAVVCLNSDTASLLSRYHSNVKWIPPLPSVDRLENSAPIPGELRRKIIEKKVITFPVVLDRISREFPVKEIVTTLLEQEADTYIIFACRFNHEGQAKEWLPDDGSLHDRVGIYGEVEWYTSLLRASNVIVYPISDLRGKFNPPMVLTEAFALGKPIVASKGVALNDLSLSVLLIDKDSPSSVWVDSIRNIIATQNQMIMPDYMRQCWLPYKQIYQELMHLS